jgi:hypothetical protein
LKLERPPYAVVDGAIETFHVPCESGEMMMAAAAIADWALRTRRRKSSLTNELHSVPPRVCVDRFEWIGRRSETEKPRVLHAMRAGSNLWVIIPVGRFQNANMRDAGCPVPGFISYSDIGISLRMFF